MEIKLPSIDQQKDFVFDCATQEAIDKLLKNKDAPVIEELALEESKFCSSHLLPLSEGWKPPATELVEAYFNQFKTHTDYDTDKKLGEFLGLTGNHADRRIRAYKTGKEQVPYNVWRTLLVATGRVVPEIPSVIAFMR